MIKFIYTKDINNNPILIQTNSHSTELGIITKFIGLWRIKQRHVFTINPEY
jgi:hypothetical protein